MTISDSKWEDVKKSMDDTKLTFNTGDLDSALSKAKKITSEIANISLKIDFSDNRQNAKLLDVATYVATQLDNVANSIGDENIRYSIIECRNSLAETVRPIVIRYIDKALALYRYATIIIESGDNIEVPMDVYNNASEMQETIKLLRNYWAA